MENKQLPGSENEPLSRWKFGLYSLLFYSTLATVFVVSVKYHGNSVGGTIACVGMVLAVALECAGYGMVGKTQVKDE